MAGDVVSVRLWRIGVLEVPHPITAACQTRICHTAKFILEIFF